jgi:signal transduction histidine kinase
VTRLISNLLDNAIRYNVPDGRVWVRTGTDEGGPFLSVRNTGPVVRPEQVELLFQPFQRLDTRVWGPREGLGLGLSIVAAIVTAHGATLRAVPAAGGGLDVRVGFPAVAGSARPTRRAALPGRATATP